MHSISDPMVAKGIFSKRWKSYYFWITFGFSSQSKDNRFWILWHFALIKQQIFGIPCDVFFSNLDQTTMTGVLLVE